MEFSEVGRKSRCFFLRQAPKGRNYKTNNRGRIFDAETRTLVMTSREFVWHQWTKICWSSIICICKLFSLTLFLFRPYHGQRQQHLQHNNGPRRLCCYSICLHMGSCVRNGICGTFLQFRAPSGYSIICFERLKAWSDTHLESATTNRCINFNRILLHLFYQAK